MFVCLFFHHRRRRRQGRRYEWRPHWDDDQPCALLCRPVDAEAPVALLAAGVHDGTRCHEGRLDMCIDGQCQVREREPRLDSYWLPTTDDETRRPPITLTLTSRGRWEHNNNKKEPPRRRPIKRGDSRWHISFSFFFFGGPFFLFVTSFRSGPWRALARRQIR